MTSSGKFEFRKTLPPLIAGGSDSRRQFSTSLKGMIRALVPPYAVSLLKRIFAQRTSKKSGPGSREDIYWDERAVLLDNWGEKHVWNEIQMFLFSRSGKVLDIACGTGKTLTRLGYYPALDLYGFDHSDFLIRECLRYFPYPDKLRVMDAGASRWDYGDGQFNFTFSIGLAYYFNDEQLKNFVDECSRVTGNMSMHMILVSESMQDEEFIFTWQEFRNNSLEWWKRKFGEKFSEVLAIPSAWQDNEYKKSRGIWLICKK